MNSPLFATTHQLLQTACIDEKCQGVVALYDAWLNDNVFFDACTPVSEEVIGALPESLVLVPPKEIKKRNLTTKEGKAALIHAIAHIEYNAINIALDALYRFRDMPLSYYADWLRIAREEAYHFSLLSQHLISYGYHYGDFPAHLGLWEMVQKTSHDVLIRMALVPRLLEARGLDVTPDISRRLSQVNDMVGSEILKIIFFDEIHHVRIGNYWYYQLCRLRNLNPQETFIKLLNQYAPQQLRGPIAVHHRLKAGFDENELELLIQMVKA
ncbi:MAG: ferritin-like domain-containing protein [Proteobacteria bacterium]|nr:ferritin-like domain-containing protein [Pseudomonadota bacterium]